MSQTPRAPQTSRTGFLRFVAILAAGHYLAALAVLVLITDPTYRATAFPLTLIAITLTGIYVSYRAALSRRGEDPEQEDHDVR